MDRREFAKGILATVTSLALMDSVFAFNAIAKNIKPIYDTHNLDTYESEDQIFVKNLQPIFEELVERNTVHKEKLRLNTPWGTNEFGFYDLNSNAIFFVEDI